MGKLPGESFDMWTQLKKYNSHLLDPSIAVNSSINNYGIYQFLTISHIKFTFSFNSQSKLMR